ncbi:unnamed protein product, partial [marine sediment metagenome]
MIRGRKCPVCLKVWEWTPEYWPETCPTCPGVLLLAVYD